MGWRFRKSFKILPGVRMNVGSKGVTSWSFGGRGVRVNVGKRGTTTTYSLFGTGLSYLTHTPRARPGQATVTIRPGLQAATPPSLTGLTSTKRRPVGTYVLVGVAALITYIVLKPEGPPLQDRVASVQPSLRAPEEQRSSRPPVPATVTAVSAATPGDAMTTTGANVRSSASMSGLVVRVLDAGTQVRVVGQEGNWRLVADPGGEPWGWVHGSILR